METRSLRDGSESFDVTVHDVERPSRVVLFAVGGGGDPARHAPLLDALAERGCAVVAPRFERLPSPVPSDEHLLLRGRRLRLALDSVARPDVPVVGVGHSLGATTLLALAGADVWTRPGGPLPIARDARITRLALMAPATGFFQAPGALDSVRVPIHVWVGEKDTVTPPAQAELLKRALDERVELRVAAGADHFSFMHVPPPHVTEPLADREAFLSGLVAEVCAFVDDRTAARDLPRAADSGDTRRR